MTKHMWVVLLAVLMLAGCGKISGIIGGKATAEEGSKAYTLAQEGKVEELRALLQENPGICHIPVSRDSYLLEIVVDIRPAFPNMYQTIHVLLECGADPNLKGPKILRKAIWHDDPETFQLLLEYGADPLLVWEKNNINMLEYARSKGDKRLDLICYAWEQAQGK